MLKTKQNKKHEISDFMKNYEGDRQKICIFFGLYIRKGHLKTSMWLRRW
jgi:hypothetical protein